MQELLAQSAADGARLSEDQIYDQVLGTRSGCVKGLGFGPRPTISSSGTTSMMQDLQEKLKQSQDENHILKQLLDEEIKKGERREATLAKYEALFRRMFGSEYDE